MATAAKASDPAAKSSTYRPIENSMSEALKQVVQNTIHHPSEVAKVVLQAVTSDNPDFRHIVEKGAASSLEARRNIPDREFQDLIKKQLNLQNIS
jgi:hypothetical protein